MNKMESDGDLQEFEWKKSTSLECTKEIIINFSCNSICNLSKVFNNYEKGKKYIDYIFSLFTIV